VAEQQVGERPGQQGKLAAPATATVRARLTTAFQVSGRACAASIAAAFAATGRDFPAFTGSPGS
jgi:hypothetical protein